MPDKKWEYGAQERRQICECYPGAILCYYKLPIELPGPHYSDVYWCSHSLDAKKGSESNSALGRKSQDAAVGALVHMLRTAPPLRQDSSYYSTHSQSTQQAGNNFETASGFFMARKAADAFEELKGYKEMKDLLLSKSGNRVVNQEDLKALPVDIKGRKL
ncbi:Autophagy-related protein 13a [Bienertia sinuspersici]